MGSASPLAGWDPRQTEGLRLAEVPFLTQVNLRLSPKDPAADAVGLELGVPLPVEPGTTTRAGDLTVLWLGPDEWLVIGPPGADVEHRLRAVIAGEPASVVDLSAQRTTIGLAGRWARDLLAHGCAVDLHPSRFPAGRCAQTMLAHAQVVLLATDDEPAYRILVPSSFARYLAEWLDDAAIEYWSQAPRES